MESVLKEVILDAHVRVESANARSVANESMSAYPDVGGAIPNGPFYAGGLFIWFSSLLLVLTVFV